MVSAFAAWLAAAAVLVAAPAPGSAQEPPADADELWSLHDSVEAPGLESRKFGPDEYWGAVLPVV
ncbi:MAG: hypothetical protein Q8W44_03850, partial [Candidatus Palauibacterales bacterium]|nr:hypothetical protein [Candidatus Palauibacterales bacterium]